jgi:hypothetical protein
MPSKNIHLRLKLYSVKGNWEIKIIELMHLLIIFLENQILNVIMGIWIGLGGSELVSI